MQTTTFVGQASGIDATLIKIVAQLTNADLSLKEEGIKCSLVQTVKHLFTDVSQEFSAVGMSGAVRLLLKGNSSLLGSTPAQQAAVDSWIESIDQSLLPVLRQGVFSVLLDFTYIIVSAHFLSCKFTLQKRLNHYL
jgi:hypothetical protein